MNARTLLYAVHPRYGAWWVSTNPKPRLLFTELVRLWGEGYATESVREVAGRRDVRV